MAARTITYTAQMAGPPKGAHVGLNVVPFDFNSGATKFGTVSDVLLLAKIPNGALITEMDLRTGANGSAATTFTVLLLATESGGTTLSSIGALSSSIASITGGTAAAAYRMIAPFRVSLSDDRAVQYAILALNCTVGASETVSFSLQGSVKFLTDGTPIV